tara:strand:+ start:71 stop:454 length:384 start_codon:yes stop_codon:yes gene_type:complete
MGYRIEVSLALKNLTSFTETKHKIVDKSKKNNCVYFYENYETTKKKQKLIYTFIFEEENDIVSFIRYIKDTPKVYIDSIYMEDPTVILLYASKEYIKIMDRDKVNDYLQKKKSCELYQHAPNIIKII